MHSPQSAKNSHSLFPFGDSGFESVLAKCRKIFEQVQIVILPSIKKAVMYHAKAEYIEKERKRERERLKGGKKRQKWCARLCTISFSV